jgi:hypothetical protein
MKMLESLLYGGQRIIIENNILIRFTVVDNHAELQIGLGTKKAGN